MALTRPPQKKQQKKPSLEAAGRVKVENTVKREDVVPETEKEPTSITFPANIRADNHIRNELSAFLNLGIEKNMKSLLSHLIEREIESLVESELSRFNKMVSILEEKDYMSKSLKNSSK